MDFKFECIGSRQTDDELVIAGSLKEFGKLIAAIEDEKDRMVGDTATEFSVNYVPRKLIVIESV